MGLKPGDPDPHWQLVAVSNHPDFKPQPAVVRIDDSRYLTNDPARSQWISGTGELTKYPDQTTYTFRTTFELPASASNSAVLRCRFLGDDHVEAVRLNGRTLDISKYKYNPRDPIFIHWRDVGAASGFVVGSNVLEIDVFNGGYPGATLTAQVPCRFARNWQVLSSRRRPLRPAAKGKPVADSPTLKTGG